MDSVNNIQVHVGNSPCYTCRAIVAQVVALERLHDINTRCDSYTLFLSDGSATDESDLAACAQPVSLDPTLNHLIETRKIKLHSIIQMNQYIIHEQQADIGPYQTLITPKT